MGILAGTIVAACTGQIGGLAPSSPETTVAWPLPLPTATLPARVAVAAEPTATAAPVARVAVLPTATPAVVALPTPVPTPAIVAPPEAEAAPSPAPTAGMPPAISITVPLRTLDEADTLATKPEVAEILEAARRYPESRVYLAAYATEADSRARSADVKSVSDELVLAMGRTLAARGIAPERISGRGMGANPTIGRAVVVSLDVAEPSGRVKPSPRKLVEQEAAIRAPERLPPENTAFKEVAGGSAYRVGAGDTLKITSWLTSGPQEFVTTVAPDGTATFYLVREVPVAGLTTKEIESLVTNVLKRYIRNPQITVSVAGFGGHSVTLMSPEGAKKIVLAGRTTVLDLVSGRKLSPNVDLKAIRIMRGGQEYSVNLYRTVFDKDWAENMVLDDGDVIVLQTFLQSGSYVLLLGAVNSPGMVPINTPMTAAQALLAGGGAGKGAYLPHARIVRGNLSRPQIIPANVDRVIEKGDLSATVYVQGGDVLFVPSTRITNWNAFLQDIRPTLEFATLPFRYGLGGTFLFDRGRTVTTKIVVQPTPGPTPILSFP